MVQAARSGRQNIAEGNRAGAVSSKSELELTNWARASQEELLLDFQDYLRQRKLPLWPQDSPEASAMKTLGRKIGARKDQTRSDASERTDLSQKTDRDFPKCPQCAKLMTLCTARQGKHQGSQFWGCTGYPDCKGAVPLDTPAP
jgi:hypothetical protein